MCCTHFSPSSRAVKTPIDTKLTDGKKTNCLEASLVALTSTYQVHFTRYRDDPDRFLKVEFVTASTSLRWFRGEVSIAGIVDVESCKSYVQYAKDTAQFSVRAVYNTCLSVCCRPTCSLRSRWYPPVLCHSSSGASFYVCFNFVCFVTFCFVGYYCFLALRRCPLFGLLNRPWPTSWTYVGLLLCYEICLFPLLVLSSVWSFRVVLLLVHQLDISQDWSYQQTATLSPCGLGLRPESMFVFVSLFFFFSCFFYFPSCFFPFSLPFSPFFSLFPVYQVRIFDMISYVRKCLDVFLVLFRCKW